jgi:hypothetical protein
MVCAGEEEQKKEQHINLNFIICSFYTPHKLISLSSFPIIFAYSPFYATVGRNLYWHMMKAIECPNISTNPLEMKL